ncbi:hypothetical protein EV426DRAFT_717798 [Tirmania nivea]|nr:hypothetical protein EV426DRAFT_717798 [Tirmania nivea]
MFSAKMKKLFVFVLLYGCSVPLGSALPRNFIHGQHITGASVTPIVGHLKARASFVDYTEAYNQLMKLLHEMYGDDVGKVLQDPEWLKRVCSKVCVPDDQKCHQECAEKQIGYFDVNHIARCATYCENIPHKGEASLQGEYGACLVPCLKHHRHENTNAVEIPTKENSTPTSAVDAPSANSKINQSSSQAFPYSVTLMDAGTTSVIQVISQVTHEVEDLYTEDKELKYLTPAVKIVTSSAVVNSDTNIAEVATGITNTIQTVSSADLNIENDLNQPAFFPVPSFTSDTSASPGTALPPVAGTTLVQLVDATLPLTSMAPTPPPSTLVFSTGGPTVIDEDSHLIPSNTDNNVNQFDIVAALATVVTDSDLETPALSSTPTVMTNISGALTTPMVDLDDLEASVPGVMKKVGSILNFTNMTSTSTGTSVQTLEPGLAEGAAAIHTPFLSFGSSTSVLLAVVIGFGLIME